MKLVNPEINGYDILDELPRGGWGRVFKAKYNNKIVALKVLNDTTDQKIIDLFFQEAEVIRRLESPHIVKILSTGNQESKPYYFTMEYCGKGNLESFLKIKKILTLNEIKKIGIAIAKALVEIHKAKIIHLDLKPSNILFAENDRIVVSDFGVSLAGSNNHSYDKISGTPQYMSPEVFDGKPVLQSDFYSLGIILYYAMAGQLPFNSSDFIQLGLLHKTAIPLPISEYNKYADKVIISIINKLLEKKPENRYIDAHELLTDFENIKTTDSSTSQNLRITVSDKNHDKIDSRIFKKYPVTISKLQKSGSNIRITDPFASREHATILKPEEGVFIYSDHSKNGSKVNGSLLNDESTELNLLENTIIIGDTKLLIQKIESKTVQINYKYILISAGVIGFIALILLFIKLFSSSVSPAIEIYGLSGVPDTLYQSDDFTFNFGEKSTINYAPKQIIIAPFGKDKIQISQDYDKKNFSYSSMSTFDLKGTFQFFIKVRDVEGKESNWLSKNITILPPSSNIKLYSVTPPSRIIVNSPNIFKYDFISAASNENLILKVSTDGINNEFPIKGKEFQWTFSHEGSYTLQAQIHSKADGSVSNIIALPCEVSGDYVKPTIEFVGEPGVVGKYLSITYNFNDPKYTNNADIQIKIHINNSVKVFSGATIVNNFTTPLDPGSYNIWIEIRTRDNRSNRTPIMQKIIL